MGQMMVILDQRHQTPVFITPNSYLRRVFAWAGERRGRAPEPQFAAPPVATRNGLTQPTRIGAFTVSERHFAKTERRSKVIPCVFWPINFSQKIPEELHFSPWLLSREEHQNHTSPTFNGGRFLPSFREKAILATFPQAPSPRLAGIRFPVKELRREARQDLAPPWVFTR